MNIWFLSEYESLEFKVKVTLRLMVSQSVSLGVEAQIFITVWHLRSSCCGAPSLTGGWFCLLYTLLGLASAVFLGSESLGTRDHILLSHIWNFPFHRLLRLAGSRWRYSTPPPHGYVSIAFYNCHSVLREVTVSKVSTTAFHECVVSETCMNGCLAKYIIPCLPPLFRLLSSVYQTLLSKRLFQLVDQEMCFNKPLSNNGLFRHNAFRTIGLNGE
jgi:hypothetical protein